MLAHLSNHSTKSRPPLIVLRMAIETHWFEYWIEYWIELNWIVIVCSSWDAVSAVGCTVVYRGAESAVRVQRKSLYQLGHLQWVSPFALPQCFYVSTSLILRWRFLVYRVQRTMCGHSWTTKYKWYLCYDEWYSNNLIRYIVPVVNKKFSSTKCN
jgi:hypothetical protein